MLNRRRLYYEKAKHQSVFRTKCSVSLAVGKQFYDHAETECYAPYHKSAIQECIRRPAMERQRVLRG